MNEAEKQAIQQMRDVMKPYKSIGIKDANALVDKIEELLTKIDERDREVERLNYDNKLLQAESDHWRAEYNEFYVQSKIFDEENQRLRKALEEK